MEKSKIFTYDEWYIDQICLNQHLDTTWTKGDLHPRSSEIIHDDNCIYCQKEICWASQKLQDFQMFGHDWREGFITTRVTICPFCGFWHIQEIGNFQDRMYEKVYISILKEFSISDIEAPLNKIENYLSKRPEDIYLIDPKKLEELVGHMLKEYLDCEVQLTKSSRDGGIDLICIDSERGKRLVQVKRYKKDRKITVNAIRELAGVILRENATKGLFVSTSGYTQDAIKEMQQFKRSNHSYPIDIDLYSVDEILAFLQLIESRHKYELLSKPLLGEKLKIMQRVEKKYQGFTVSEMNCVIMNIILP